MVPIFRGKHYRDDIYFIGSLIGKQDEYYIIEDKDMEYYRPIDITTLAIHFPNMTDSQGNKIFASLSGDGKGGDIFILGDERLKYIAKMHNNQLMAKQQGTYGSLIGQGYAPTKKWKVIGIQK